MNYPNIEKYLGTHQDLSIIYVVDGYDASLSNEDRSGAEFSCFGKTIEEALAALDQELSGLPSTFSMRKGT